MTRTPVFTSIEMHSQISTFESFVFTFYLNERVSDKNPTFGRNEKSSYLCSAIQRVKV